MKTFKQCMNIYQKTMTKYIKVEWPDYQGFMERLDFHEKCFFCAEDNSYFIPEDLYEEITYKLQFPKKYENTNLGTIVCYETRAIVNGKDTYWYDENTIEKGNTVLLYNHDDSKWYISKVVACHNGFPILLEDSDLLIGINCELIGHCDTLENYK